MRGLVRVLADRIDDSCHRSQCGKDRCWMSMEGVPANHLLVDVDCDALSEVQTGPRADYLFVAEREVSWVVPMELKSGRFAAEDALEQLQGTATVAERWIPAHERFLLVPVVAHGGKSMRRTEQITLRRTKITLHGRKGQALLRRCGDEIAEVLDASKA